jgi:SAM-dependent methyltransferase
MTQDETAMDAEFDVVAGWTMEAVQKLGPDHAIPAACRGSASPAALAWLGEACELGEGTRFLDDGAGLGGPAAYAAERFGVRPVLLEPMAGACRAAVTLFDLPTIVGSGTDLPFAAASLDAVWCLGVLCTTPRKADVLREVHRVLRPGGSVGLLVFLARHPDPAGAPEGNSFPTEPELRALLESSGLDVVEFADSAEFADAPLSWSERITAVEQAIETAHGDDPRFRTAQEQERRIGALMADGEVSGRLLHAIRR